uniref:Uncharacterized protein n=1 Tax=viral metagenome TaxID=1070528 RepID=A0A6M3IZ49_9ZZZZ
MAVNWILGSDVGNPLNVIIFSSIVHRRYQAKQYFMRKKMVQKRKHTGDENPFEHTSRAPIVLVEKMGPGDGGQQVRIPMLQPLQRSMKVGDTSTWEATDNSAYTRGVESMIDYEERIRTLNARIWVQNMQHSAAMYDPYLQDLRLAFRASLKVSDLLSNWYSNAKEELYLDALYDRFASHITGSSLASAAVHPNILLPQGVATPEQLGPAHTLTGALLRGARGWIETTGFLAPLDSGDQNGYILLTHPYCQEDILRDPEVFNALKDARPRSVDHPILKGADYEYAGFYLFSYSRVRRPDASYENFASIRRNLIMGADCLLEAETYRPMIVPRTENKYRTVAGWGIKSINGQARPDFVDADSANPINQSSAELWCYTNATGGVSTFSPG